MTTIMFRFSHGKQWIGSSSLRIEGLITLITCEGLLVTLLIYWKVAHRIFLDTPSWLTPGWLWCTYYLPYFIKWVIFRLSLSPATKFNVHNLSLKSWFRPLCRLWESHIAEQDLHSRFFIPQHSVISRERVMSKPLLKRAAIMLHTQAYALLATTDWSFKTIIAIAAAVHL